MEAQKPAILILNEKEISSHGLTLLTLPHPKENEGGILFCQSGANIYELQRVQPRKYGTWFIDQRIASDSSYLMASKFDCKFLLLPFLQKNTRYSPLDQIVTYTEGCDRLPLEHSAQWNLGDICDINDQLGDDLILYRLNIEKTLVWLQAKVDKTALYICNKRIKTLATQVSTFNSGAQSSQGQGQDQKADQRATDPLIGREDIVEALAVLCDLLTDTMAEQLLAAYSVSMESIVPSTKSSSQKRKANWETALEVEKETLSYSSAVCATSSGLDGSTKKPPPSSSGVKKAATSTTKKVVAPVKGAGSIMSFFGKKK